MTIHKLFDNCSVDFMFYFLNFSKLEFSNQFSFYSDMIISFPYCFPSFQRKKKNVLFGVLKNIEKKKLFFLFDL